MLIDRYAPEDVFAPVPELAGQTDPQLKALDVLLDDDQLFEQVKTDLARSFPHTADRGRHSTPVEAILRLLLVKHLHNWSFQETEERVADSLVLRWFTRVYFRRVPDDPTLIRWSRLIRPETLEALNERMVQLAVQARVTSGRKLRVDATCVPTTIHHPTDSGLLVDSVRVLSRIVQRAKPILAQTRRDVAELCRSRMPRARRIAQSLHRLLRRKGEEKLEQQRELYQHLVQTTEEMVQQTQQVSQALRRRGDHLAQQLRDQVQQFLPLVKRVIAQTRNRVLEGQKVASEEKVLSLFEPHTRVIPRHKGGADVKFGRLMMQGAGGGRPRDPF
jgi:IS5 family transposase